MPRVPRLAPLLALAAPACGLDTRLADERDAGPSPPAARRGRDGGVEAGAGAWLVDPPAGEEELPRNLASIVVAFARPLEGARAALALRAGGGGAPPLGPPGGVACPSGAACYALAIEGTLPPLARVELWLSAASYLEDGEPVGPGLVGRFGTSALLDARPPRLGPLRVEPLTDCVRLRVRGDEPVALDVRAREAAGAPEQELARTAPRVEHDIALRAARPVGEGATLSVIARDRAGHAAPPAVAPWTPPPPGPRLVITEVHANPAGPEGIQEYVEILNLETRTIDLAGHVLEDAQGGDRLPALALAPGAFALVVPSGFDPAALPEPVRAPLVKVDERLGKDGLAAQEAVRLRAPGGLALSSYGGWISMSGASWSGRSTHRTRADACDHPGVWTSSPAPPTPGY